MSEPFSWISCVIGNIADSPSRIENGNGTNSMIDPAIG